MTARLANALGAGYDQPTMFDYYALDYGRELLREYRAQAARDRLAQLAAPERRSRVSRLLGGLRLQLAALALRSLATR